MSLPKSRVFFKCLTVWSIIFLCADIVHARKQNDDSSSVDCVYRARCASRCLSLHSTRIPALSTRNLVERNGSIGWCQKYKQCAKCLEPCKDTWEIKRRSQCRDLCESWFPGKSWECVTSCEFLQSLSGVKQGECPPAEQANGFAAACVEECEEDKECPAQRKCCANGCGHTCQPAKNPNKGVPLKPRMELSFRESPPGLLEVGWSSRFNVSAEPVLYVLQRRWNFGIQPSEDAATPWQLVAQTTVNRARVTDIRGGRWYQFRVAAVNVHGTRGFTTPSRHLHSTRDPSRPPASTDLRVTDLTFGPGRVVSARVLWSTSRDTDVPVNHYKVAWSWAASGGSTVPGPPRTKRRKIVREAHVDLDSLRANRTYTVEVTAVSYWKHTQIKGPKSIVHFSTNHQMEKVAGTSPLARSLESILDMGTPLPQEVILDVGTPLPQEAILDVGTPFYQDGQLQVRVYWQRSPDLLAVRYRVQWEPLHCEGGGGGGPTRSTEKLITRESFASLHGLLFSCRYLVLLRPLDSPGRRRGQSTSFITPSCPSIQAKSSKDIACPRKQTPPLKFSAQAENLTAVFEGHNGNVTAVFSWDLSPPEPTTVVMGYQVTWTEVSAAGRNSHLPSDPVTWSQILPSDQNTLVVSGLRLASVYRLDVQVMGVTAEGPVASRSFQTPGPPVVKKHKIRHRKHNQRQLIIKRH